MWTAELIGSRNGASLSSLRSCDVKAGIVLRGVGVIELEKAIAVGGALAEVLLDSQIAAGLHVKALSGRTLRLQQHRAVRAPLQGDGRVLDGHDLRPARRRGFIPGHINIAVVIHGDGVAHGIAIARPVIALQPNLIPVRIILNRHNVIT